jgi:long-chain acyl-CoA synthetase
MSDTDVYAAQPWRAAYGARIAAELPPPAHANLVALAREAGARHADRIAFTCVVPNGMNGSLRYREVESASDAFAAYLRVTLRLAAGARVAVQMPNGLAYPVVVLGTWKAGCVLVNTNPLYTAAEMIHQFNDASVEVLVLVELFADKLLDVLPRTGVRHVVVTSVPEFFPAIPRVIVRAVQRWWDRSIGPIKSPHVRLTDALAAGRKALAGGADAAVWSRDLTHDSLAALQYTGGTTGVSKGAMLSHGNLLANIDQIHAMNTGDFVEGRETVLTALPLYHIFALTANFLAFYAMGGRNVLIPSPRPVQNLQRAIENYPITWITGVNTLFNALLNEEWFAAYPPKSVKVAVAGGTALQGAVAERWKRVTGVPITEGYGLTETSPCVSFNAQRERVVLDSIGIPVPGTAVRLVDDDGRGVPLGQPGELMVRGPQVMQGYWQRPDETAKVMRDGWFHTGDIAVMDEHGWFKIVDRKKDLVIVSGFNVYPNEVEDALARMDAVLEGAVVGIPDARSGEAVRAYVVRNPDWKGELTREMVIAHCRTLLTDYKVPKSIVFRDELPKTPVGKILRKDLKAEVKAEFAAG